MKREILIIEDDSEIRNTMIDFLEDEGFVVRAAENGAQGISILQESATLPGLIFLDIMMPVMDGIEFRSTQLKDVNYSKIPTVIFSADGRVNQKVDTAGTVEVLKKPVELDDVINLANKYCSE
jgi:CheY-like chemotaxis protein